MSEIMTDLTAATTPLAGAESVYLVQSGNSRKTTVADVRGEAADLPYDNGTSGLTATDTQAAIDELTGLIGTPSAAVVTFDPTGLVNTSATDVQEALEDFDAAIAAASFTAASTTEVLTGTNSSKGVTPDSLAALWEKGSDIASAGTISIGEGGYFHVTGTTTITDIDWGTAKDGRWAWLIFDGILTFTHHSTTLKLPTGANITTAAGDRALVIQDNGDNAICVVYQRADGTALSSAGAFTAASTTEVLTGTDSSKGVTPDALAALWEKGSDEASAGTVSFGEGGYFHVTGTTTITDLDWDTAKDGRMAWVVFDGALTLTHHATTLILPTGANITTAAGDRALFVQDASDNVICLCYIPAGKKPLYANVSANLTVGYTATGFSAGTKSSGTFTPDPANGSLQYATNGGAHTLAPPSTGSGDAVSMVIQYTNNGSAGTITTSGFTKVTGSGLTTTNGDDFMFYITVLNSFSHLNVVALQ